ncbi:MAG: bifunctional D-glycero-beta-D-manno-heptose-7-phosphate kinase/D-glycero-beta-D-manno-heptose 1-phosphate adenylyltransferase HldE [Planctomycetota bacterium]|nr:MAG: bifunctional D-glycero-beta-D-manno-heptose-7-phosphate kinase/D-glycero-beta-D-manno-heptose 1-phosphate adenylyltransferase HldE [Planctomycetota bacterium]
MGERELIRVLQELAEPRVAVVGDFMLDHYLWGDAGRVSPEAPVPVVHARREEHRLGGAGNVVANLAGLGARVGCFGAVGRDEPGRRLAAGLEECGADTAGLVTCRDRPTTQKIRVMARSQQMLRVDREEPEPLSDAEAEALLAALTAAEWDAVVLSDYGKGVLSDRILAAVLAEARRRGVPSLVDPKRRDFAAYAGATAITPNRAEAEAALGRLLPDLDALAAGGEELRRQAGVEVLLITLSAEGMFLVRADREPLHLPTAARQVYDVTGAGDTVIAALAAALAAGRDWETSVRLANAAAGLAVARVGTAAVGRQELLHHLSAASPDRKVVHGEALAPALAELRREANRIVFTNGCFDILHAGHVRYLAAARALGDALVVGLNDDDSVRRLKGQDRPFNPLADRAEVLAALESVDLVVPFAEDTPAELIERVRPDVLAKGADWAEKGVVGAEFVRAHGGEVRLIDLLPGRSTTGLAERIRRR